MALLSLLVTLALGIYVLGDIVGGPFVAGLIVVSAVLLAVWNAIRNALPVQPRLTPATPADLLQETAVFVDALAAGGFEQLGDGFTANLPGAPLVLPFVHRSHAMLAAVYELRVPKQRALLDFVTMFDDGAMLTTASSHEAGALSPLDGWLLQIGNGADTAALLAMHCDGVTLLRSGRQPLGMRDMTAEKVAGHITDCLRAQRRAFDRAPVRRTLVAFWRTLTRRNPYLVPLREQPRRAGDRRAQRLMLEA